MTFQTAAVRGFKLGNEPAPSHPRLIALADPKAEILGPCPDESPAIVMHQLGKGRAIAFATNPFALQVAVDAKLWPAAFKGLQRALGCKVDQPIWHFALPSPPQ